VGGRVFKNLKIKLMHKLFSFIPTCILLINMQFARTQTLDQVLDNHFRASGQEYLNNVKTVRSSGRALQMDMELPFLQIQKRPDKMYLEIDVQGIKIIQTYNGKEGWIIEPWIDNHPRELTRSELRNIELMAGIDSDLINWKENGYSLELTGKDVFDERVVYDLKLVKNGETYRFLIDSDTWLINKMVTGTNNDGNIVSGETILGDYRKIDGIYVPFRTEVIYGGETLMTNIIDKVEFDMEIDENIFEKP
jgi:outer membrane lipoprotein-sorting protein